ncbi:MAG TPA: rubredoxin [Rhodospirillaceae bacterium]|nr:MAG: rubredoxin [Alphaproteobacteria bacterium GWF2_58_20]HAU28967.1 rubredoxin [Rhodospirillaceae bacterium]
MKKYKCIVCGYIYDEAKGDPAHGILPGTTWENVPKTWTCPDCGVTKSDFELIK